MINTNRVIALGCWIMLASLQGCSRESNHPDVQFAKTTFFSMINGTADETAIDWATFRAEGKDVGAEYRALPGDAEKAEYRKSFLLGFFISTPNLRANPDHVTHWRVKSKNTSETIVAADMQMQQGADMLITVTKRDGSQKISSLEVKE